ncbi:Glyoxylate/hydroxypyruvate reductase B [Rhodobacteraceae bacterium THAF1]|uniref:2-hydroxyacid dehydrogenase n=1 Tax=Palleronia sp. THAF1 TaxID=2587842 RepID=UPI000F3FF8AA|nr:2-hydroxyacid dehydrogenase [Palleronia sp. THAF1]QFU09650.1 Glyoxylate/hydroxypyruvate reductase B [Palleronia sp. THAF1]VDC17449.1 Glyoxylate/hydroxypyruvate reductase B [Rhodobacteraceae bacterium THAF1]
MTKTLAIGGYTETDRAAYEADLSPVFLDGPAALADMEEAARAEVTAIGYKGHHAFGAEQMDLLPNLGLIANFGVGYDAINIPAADARGVKVTNTPDVLNDDVADLAVGMLLAQVREMMQASEWARDGNWAEKGEYRLNRKVSGNTVGILGLGRIGHEIADRLAAFKMDIHYWSRSEKETPGWTYHDDPVALAQAVDFLIVALVGGPDTEKFVSKEVIAAMGERGVLINISRGSTVDEEALIAALKDGTISGAGLDVFLNEPKIDARFYDLPNVVIQPHQGSGTVETRAAMGQLQRDNITAFHAGDSLLTPVN